MSAPQPPNQPWQGGQPPQQGEGENQNPALTNAGPTQAIQPGQPVPPPGGYEEFDRISVQPRLGPQDSCLMWQTVDFFLLPSGDVAAITLDLWEP